MDERFDFIIQQNNTFLEVKKEVIQFLFTASRTKVLSTGIQENTDQPQPGDRGSG